MSAQGPSRDAFEVHVESVGGIDETTVALRPGVAVLTGRNATNRTSFLQALMAALGSDRASLKGDADRGAVSLRLGDGTYRRTLERRDGTVVFDGNPYLDDPTTADLFAFLLEGNEARQAVRAGGDLRDIVMRPVDTDELEARIEELVAERREIDDRIDAVEARTDELDELRAEREELRTELTEERAALEDAREAIAAADADLETRRERQSELEAVLDELATTRSSLEDVRYRLETEREALSAAREERAAVEEERADLPDSPTDQLEEIRSRIHRLRNQKRDCETAISKLQSLVQFNEEMLSGEGALRDLLGDDAGPATDRLLEERTTCWTCGSEVDVDSIEEMVDRLRELSREQRHRRRELDEELSELDSRRRSLEAVEERRAKLDRREQSLADDVEGRTAEIERLTARRDDLVADVDRLETEAAELELDDDSELLDLHRRASRLEATVSHLEEDVESVEREIADVESDLAELDELGERRDAVREELSDLRTRIERLEREALEAFDEHMNDLLDTLDYGNVERIWIERVDRERREGRQTAPDPSFDLHVVRRTESGSAYEDTVAHLSESEREVTGLVFALAGYLTHEAYETVPFVLLDSLEAIDSGRIAALVDYFRQYAPNIVVALLPEDAAALDDAYQRVHDI